MEPTVTDISSLDAHVLQLGTPGSPSKPTDCWELRSAPTPVAIPDWLPIP